MTTKRASHNTPHARAALAARLTLWLGDVALWLAFALARLAPALARHLKRDVTHSMFDAAADVRLLVAAHAMTRLQEVAQPCPLARPPAVRWRRYAGRDLRRAARPALRGWRAGDLRTRAAALRRIIDNIEHFADAIARRIAAGLRHGGLAPMPHPPILQTGAISPGPAAHADTS